MKKRILPILLSIVMILPMMSVPAYAAASYSQVPILTGYEEVDYLADQLLKEIPTAGKSTRDQIKAVYDWIINHCKRNDWDGTYYYDEQAVKSAAATYGTNMEQRLFQGKAVLRQEMETLWNIEGSEIFSLDSNYTIASKAQELMWKRTGDCVNFSSLFSVLLGHLGYDCRMIGGEFINPNGSHVSHKWNYVLIDGKYYWFDIRIDHSLFTRRGYISYEYFMVPDTSTWTKTHEWNHAYSDLLAARASNVEDLYNQAIREATSAPSYDEVETDAGSLYSFWKTNEYIQGQFQDVQTGDWYAENVRSAYEYGLLLGNGDGRFGVGDNLTIAQTLAIAGRLHNRYYGGSGRFFQGDPWHQVYVDYATRYQIMAEGQYDPLATATRAQFAEIMSNALPDEALPAINQITRIPDVSPAAPYSDSVYRLYNAGILTGNDSSGTFEPDTPIKREQVAAMATRFADRSLRKTFTL